MFKSVRLSVFDKAHMFISIVYLQRVIIMSLEHKALTCLKKDVYFLEKGAYVFETPIVEIGWAR